MFRLSTGSPWTLSRACTRPILSMVRRSPSVSNNLISGLYAEVCEMGHIPMYTNQMSFNNIIITCYWHSTSDILDLSLWDLWHDTLSCSPLTYDIYATVLNYQTCLFSGFHTIFYACFSIHIYRYTCTWFQIYYWFPDFHLCYWSLPVHVRLPEHANWLYLTYSLGYFLTILNLHV